MRVERSIRWVGVFLILGGVLAIGLTLLGGDEIPGVGSGEVLDVIGVRLAQYGNPVSIMGQLTFDGEPIPGTFFFLVYEPLTTSGLFEPKDREPVESEPVDPEVYPPGPGGPGGAAPEPEEVEATPIKYRMQLEHYFPTGTKANGAQISFIQYPNGIVTFTISPSQFSHEWTYVLPFLPEDPPGAGALEFF